MTKPRTFKRTEIMDAARAAVETGAFIRLLPTGEIEFTPRRESRTVQPPKSESLLEKWLNEGQAGGRT